MQRRIIGLLVLAVLVVSVMAIAGPINEPGPKVFENTVDIKGMATLSNLLVQGSQTNVGNTVDSGNRSISGSLTVTGNATSKTVVTSGSITAGDSLSVGTNLTLGVKTLGYGTNLTTISTSLVCSVAAYVGAVHHDIITFTNVLETFADGSDEGEDQELVKFPEGRIYILGAALNATLTNSPTFEAAGADRYWVGIGTAAADDAATLASTECDIITATVIDTASGVTCTNEWEADFTAGADSVFDNTAGALKFYFNMATSNGNLSADASVRMTGTLAVDWLLLGDD